MTGRDRVGRVAAVIPAYNPGPLLARVAASAARELGADAIYVIDDGATDGSIAGARAAGFAAAVAVAGSAIAPSLATLSSEIARAERASW